MANIFKIKFLLLAALAGCFPSDPPVPEPEFIEVFDAGYLEVIGGTSDFILDGSHLMFYIWFNGEGYMSTYGKVDVTRYQDVGGGGFHFWSVYVQEGVCEVKMLEGTYNLETDPWALMGPSWFKAWGDGLMFVTGGGSIKYGNKWYETPFQKEF